MADETKKTEPLLHLDAKCETCYLVINNHFISIASFYLVDTHYIFKTVNNKPECFGRIINSSESVKFYCYNCCRKKHVVTHGEMHGEMIRYLC